MIVRVDRAREARARTTDRTFRGRPAVIRAGNAVVDLFPSVLADVVDEHAAAGRMERERERIAKPSRPDRPVVAGCACVKRIVRRNRSVRIDAEDLSEKIRHRLRIGADGVLPCRNVELSVRTEVQRASVVVGRAQVLEVEQHGLTGLRDVGIGDTRRETADAVVDRRG